ncbi:hypothetical protein DEU56DRAFT_206233 [Suillus clintonianus]|uniref:uncharacterized protein n=1 Tax=Suillus clintonianus TaxID=1904413 RepID=UPI001B87984A|nr:uncharacterized protein DEU56DRAFT_206233 [Suillus clintonianus]KAG2144508.1 hypothetical protein DEU56DRAFT_206233 [Suillus clintonianus]
MIYWQDPEVIESWTVAFVDITFLMLGLYVWGYIHSCQVEKALFRRQFPFQWQMVSYLTGRTFYLVTVILSAVTSVAVPPHINCNYVLKFLAFSGNIVLACVSTNLVIRTWTVWKNNRFVCVFLALATLGHWSTLILDSKNTQVSSSLSSGSCGFLVVNPIYSAVTYMYAAIFYFVLVKVTIFGHWRSSSSSLWTIIRTQGIFYYCVAFFANLVPLIFSWLNLNYVTNIFFVCPATCIMTIASGRAVIPTFNTSRSLSHR